jgi:anion-transporting  ArsA/GET3 family ATPase
VSSPSDLEGEFERALEEVERSLMLLKQRYIEVQNDRQRQAQLEERLREVKQELSETQLPQLRVELKQIEAQLAALEINLESQLFSWSSLREPFWQAVRFGGLGVVVGWILKSCT